jgi:hypothetical protein
MQTGDPIAQGISNEGLTELALNSAIALDKQLRDQPHDAATVAEFFGVLGHIVNSSTNYPEARLVSDPRKVGVVSRAVRQIDKVSTVEELIAKIKQMSDAYKNSPVSSDSIARIRDFCIALHKELLAGAYRTYEDERRRESGKQNAARLS